MDGNKCCWSQARGSKLRCRDPQTARGRSHVWAGFVQRFEFKQRQLWDALAKNGCFIFDLPCLWWFIVSWSPQGSEVMWSVFFGKKIPRHPKVLGDRIWDLCTIAYVFTCFLDALRWLIFDINLEQEGFDEMETPGDSDGSTRFEGQNPEPHLYWHHIAPFLAHSGLPQRRLRRMQHPPGVQWG